LGWQIPYILQSRLFGSAALAGATDITATVVSVANQAGANPRSIVFIVSLLMIFTAKMNTCAMQNPEVPVKALWPSSKRPFPWHEPFTALSLVWFVNNYDILVIITVFCY
jgi:hypothetical protein